MSETRRKAFQQYPLPEHPVDLGKLEEKLREQTKEPFDEIERLLDPYGQTIRGTGVGGSGGG